MTSSAIAYQSLDSVKDKLGQMMGDRVPPGYQIVVESVPHRAMIAMYNIINTKNCYIFGNNNLIIGNENIVSGYGNLVIGENAIFVQTDFQGNGENVYYNIDPETFKEKTKLEKEFLQKIRENPHSTDQPMVDVIKSYYDHHLAALQLPALVPQETRRRTIQAVRHEPYPLRSQTPTMQKMAQVCHLTGQWILNFIAAFHQPTIPLGPVKRWYDEHILPLTQTNPTLDMLNQTLGLHIMLRLISHGWGEESDDDSPPPPPREILPSLIPNEPDATEAENKCILCCKRSIKTAMVPCGHSYSCVECSHHNKMQQACAICQAPFTSVIRIYTSHM